MSWTGTIPLSTVPGTRFSVRRGAILVQELLNRIFGFLLYGMAVSLDMKPSVQAASTRLCCEIRIHSVFYPNRYSAQATACSSTAAPSVLHALLLQCRQVTTQRCGVDSKSTMSSPFRKGYSPFHSEPNHYHGWDT